MIAGIGIDIIELHRIAEMLERQPRLLERILTEQERAILERYNPDKRKIEFIAGRFAAKEAFSKAMGTGLGKLSFLDIEVTTNAQGAPVLAAKQLKGATCFVSISHSDDYAVAQVIIEKESS
ncbi:holo-ACP synthase [Gracilibacillus alcaliphilus]|uniref:holo-ACP synthase n=1 Tax=Gracilibacillus alcaliphilus TaxID=1401441 RepID=UPI00195C0C90|nr:holo-ACP synthase [Gracilibacillus alcaliphilus]MBM7679284.1 holo-[acyl-carrier protein] synthase [Gracilibacillus alcaliphilus]